MAKISEIFRLGKTQYELDFVNINPDKDFPVYLNPFVFSSRTDPFSINASRTIRSFFQHNLDLIRAGKVSEARRNFAYLKEPNETCLGMSEGKPKGRGVGNDNADELFDSILNSSALASGLVDHLEDTAIFIPGIGRDKVSDMTTNIIRSNLIKYTQDQCKLLGIPLTRDVASGFFWDITTSKWAQRHEEMLVVNSKKILLVPKAVVSYVKEFNEGKYHRHYALEFLQDDHIQRGTTLVQHKRDEEGRIIESFVTKKDLIEHELSSKKTALVDFTNKYPKVFEDFRNNVSKEIESIPVSEFENINITEVVDHLIQKLREILPGNEGAGVYHSLMIGILDLIFYPNLINPIKEHEINQGRKRIDISFDNGAPRVGFFYRLQQAHRIPCPYVPVECKNYSRDLNNPELDQMIGRLSPNRGQFGIIVCRSIEDEDLLLQRCRDAFLERRDLIIPLTDQDIISILESKKTGGSLEEEILTNKARRIMNG